MSEGASPSRAETLAGSVRAGDRPALARAITLIESLRPADADEADRLLTLLEDAPRHAVIVGVTGVPGVGKSTFIERLGLHLCEQGRRVAVLAIDPSSRISGGSILGDRTRMARLSGHERAFIRPSPSGGTLGGVARRTREAARLCEAAGFDVVLIESVGVGQSETVVADCCDCLLALELPGAGDELQGVKRGLLEVVDVVAVNKADGDLQARAERTAGGLRSALHVLRAGRAPVVTTCSAANGAGVVEVWEEVVRFVDAQRGSGAFDQRRRSQEVRWMRTLVEEHLAALGSRHPGVVRARREIEGRAQAGAISARAGARRVVEAMLMAGAAGSEARRGPGARRTSPGDPEGAGNIPPSAAKTALSAGLKRGVSYDQGMVGYTTLDHVGIAVRSLEGQSAFYENVLGAHLEGVESVPEQHVRVAFYAVGEGESRVHLELLEPTDPSSPIAAFIDKRGEGLHHLAYRVDDLAARLRDLKAAGVRLTDEAPRAGARGARVAFVHPKASQGVLTELCEHSPSACHPSSQK